MTHSIFYGWEEVLGTLSVRGTWSEESRFPSYLLERLIWLSSALEHSAGGSSNPDSAESGFFWRQQEVCFQVQGSTSGSSRVSIRGPLHGPNFVHRPLWPTKCHESWYVLPLCINVINYWSPVLWAEQSFCACVVKRIGLDTSQLLHQHSTRKDALPLFSVSPLTACYLSHAVCRYLSISAISPSIHLCDCSTDSLLEFSRL